MPEKNETKDESIEQPAKVGKQAIEAGKKIHDQDKSEEQKNKEEEKDAEQWRNEG